MKGSAPRYRLVACDLDETLLTSDKRVSAGNRRAIAAAAEETLAIGDNLNELSMIKEAGLGAVVANALPELKAAADHVTVADHNQSAVTEILAKFILDPSE